MTYFNQFNHFVIKRMIDEILSFEQKIKIMEVCGTHTRTFFKSGVEKLLPKNISLISGPGCPVCVTPPSYLDTAIDLARDDGVIITTFADLIKVVTPRGSLQERKALGDDIRIVHSPLESLKVAQENSDKEIVFLGVGFETTAPIIALSIKEAVRLGVENYSLLLALKTMPAVIEELVLDDELSIDGFICPGHVSVIVGADAFSFIADKYNIPAVIAGFERFDIIMALYRILQMVNKGIDRVENLYSKAVNAKGNLKAIATIHSIFEVDDSNWHGLGQIQRSGLKLKKDYSNFDARYRFKIKGASSKQNLSCICGDILKGKKRPIDCRLFAKECNPQNPKGPCMVSEEGSCNIYYEYRGLDLWI